MCSATEPEKFDPQQANKTLKIRVNPELPSYKKAASLDDLDRDILEAHMDDVFFSYNEMAEKWGVTVATIRNRIKRMKAAGVMDVILVINPYKIGYDTFAIIGIKLESGANLEKIVRKLLTIPGVTNLVMVAGRYDFFVQYVCHNLEEYRKFVTDRLRKVAGIATVETFIGLDLYERSFELGVIV